MLGLFFFFLLGGFWQTGKSPRLCHFFENREDPSSGGGAHAEPRSRPRRVSGAAGAFVVVAWEVVGVGCASKRDLGLAQTHVAVVVKPLWDPILG